MTTRGRATYTIAGIVHRAGLGLGGLVVVLAVAACGAAQATPTATQGATHSAAPTASPSPSLAGTFTVTGSMVTGRSGQTATLLLDGRVLMAGGQVSSGYLASAELYDPKTWTFSSTGSMTTARNGHRATLLQDGRVLITGGSDGGNKALTSAELYDPKTGIFTPTGSTPATRSVDTATLLQDGRVLITGGSATPDGNNALTSAELYDPKTGTFSPSGSMTTARFGQTATLLLDGRVLITGGTAAPMGGPSLTSAELYDPKTGTFSPTGSMTTASDGYTATLCQDGRVLTAGGWDDGNRALTSVELYNPKTGTFSPTGSMTTARSFQTATLLLDGRVLIAGGWPTPGGNTVLTSAEFYDPKTGTFIPTGSMTNIITVVTATLLSDGRVLITGGQEGTWFPPAELYNP
jgi:Kelch motif